MTKSAPVILPERSLARNSTSGDIAGKGMPAALLMANLQANLRSQCATAVDQPERFLQTVNRLFYESTADNAYATFFYSEFDDQAGRLRYANASGLRAPAHQRSVFQPASSRPLS